MFVWQADDPSLTELNLNNHGKIDSNLIEQLIEAMRGNTCLTKLQMANVRFSEDHAQVCILVCFCLIPSPLIYYLVSFQPLTFLAFKLQATKARSMRGWLQGWVWLITVDLYA